MLTRKSDTLLQNELQMDPNQYKHLFLAMKKIENQSRNILVTNTIPLIETCLVFVFNWQPSYPLSLTNFTTRQLKGSIRIPENFPVVFLSKTLELKAYGTPWGKIRKPKAAALHMWNNFFQKIFLWFPQILSSSLLGGVWKSQLSGYFHYLLKSTVGSIVVLFIVLFGR